jgi:hypothetical protein
MEMSLADAEPPNLPALIDRARFRLETARTSAEALEARAAADAAHHLAKVVKAGIQVQANCLRMIDRAEKLIGEKLIEAKARGEVAKVGQPKVSSRASRIHDLGLTHDQSAYFQRRAKTPDEYVDMVFEEALEEERAPLKSEIKQTVEEYHQRPPKQPRQMPGRRRRSWSFRVPRADLIRHATTASGWLVELTDVSDDLIPLERPTEPLGRDVRIWRDPDTYTITIEIPGNVGDVHINKSGSLEFRLTKTKPKSNGD